MIGGSGGNVLRVLGPPTEKPDAELSHEALRLRKLRRAIGASDRRQVAVLKGQRDFDGGEVE